MKKTRITYNGKLYKHIYLENTPWQVFKYKVKMFFKKLFLFSLMSGALYGAFQLGAEIFPKTIYAKQIEVKHIDLTAPVMDRIKKCESGGRQFDKNGKIVTRKNKNGSFDYGAYQINGRVWSNKALELGYDIFTEQGNRDMAYWIYRNVGTAAWIASKDCWYRG